MAEASTKAVDELGDKVKEMGLEKETAEVAEEGAVVAAAAAAAAASTAATGTVDGAHSNGSKGQKSSEVASGAAGAEETKVELDLTKYGVHSGITCDGCKKKSFLGYRWKCIKCKNHDLCNACHGPCLRGISHIYAHGGFLASPPLPTLV